MTMNEKQLGGITPRGVRLAESTSNKATDAEERADRITLNVEEVSDKSSKETTIAEDQSSSVLPNIEEAEDLFNIGRDRQERDGLGRATASVA